VDEPETFADVLYESRTDNGSPDDGTDDDCDAEEEAESQCGTTGFEEEGKP
jgi:hypothetical protein